MTSVAPVRRPVAFWIAAFTAGAVVLSVEIAASRVLAPFFGNSLFVWGALIGVVLAGLAIGYWAGGALADRVPRPSLLVAVLVAGGVLVLVIPLVDDAVLEAIVRWDPGPRLDPLLAAVILFGAPSVVLAAVTPIGVRLLTPSMASVGRTSGRLFSISTAGSIAGTFATAFWLIPELGLDQLLAFAAAALFVAAATFALAERLLVPAAFAAVAVAVAASAALVLAPEPGGTLSASQARNWSPLYRLQQERGRQEPLAPEAGLRRVYQKETRYHRLAVVDDEDTRYLRFDSSFQSGMFLARPFETRFRYTDYFHLGLAYNPAARRVLFIGLGGGSAPKRMWRDLPQLEIDVAELDPTVVEVARRYFSVPDSPRLRIEAEDGRRYLARRDERWDVIAIDAFFSDSIPFHLATREFLELARSRLAPGGVIVTNAIGSIAGPGSRLFRSLYRTYGTVFPTVRVHPVIEVDGETDESVRNLILVATERPAPARAFLASRWAARRASNPRLPDLARAIRDRHLRPIPTGDVPVLTDDYAPTDALLLLD